MMLSVFCSPSRYTQGRGATAALGREMAALGLEGPALIIAGKTVLGRLADTWKSSLDEAKMRHTVYHFSGECSTAEIERAKAVARECGARTIVGAGGGFPWSSRPKADLKHGRCVMTASRRKKRTEFALPLKAINRASAWKKSTRHGPSSASDPIDLRYVRRPFTREPNFGAASVNHERSALLALLQEPA